MRGVLDHGPYDVADGLTAHDGAGRQRTVETFGAERAEEMDGVGVGGCQPLARGGERGDSGKSFAVSLEIEIEAFRTGGAFDKPIEGLGHVRYLLGDGHHAFCWTELGVGLVEDSGGASEEVLAGEELFGEVVGLRCGTHGSIMAQSAAQRLVSFEKSGIAEARTWCDTFL